MPKSRSVRLPDYLKPERYRIMLHPDFETFAFKGEETFYFSLSKETKKVVLHAKDLKIAGAGLSAKGSRMDAVVKLDPKTETAVFSFPKFIPKGKAELSISFEGKLNEFMRGFYRSSYERSGVMRHIATTQFEATDARMAFPCVDEPAAKAVFDVTLMVPKGHKAISNTVPIAVKEHESGYRAVEFAPTPRMSTYLLAFIIGEFEFVERKTKRGTLVRIFVTPGKTGQAAFAARVGAETLEFYEDYFKIRYPLPVLDMIAIPDFASGAMENWGAVTYRETAILFDEEESSTASKQWVALVIAHELAHQWFGNLVTMEWWTHLWLNEGFASYIEYLAVDHLFPEWDIWTQFVASDLGPALILDSLENTHPIEVEVGHPEEIGEIFDAVSYQKGASLIRMLASYLGERDFRNGLRHYLLKHQYANASTEDLWRAFEHVSGKPVSKIMENWTAKPGYPLVRLRQGKSGPVLEQSRFYSSRVSKMKAKDKTVWNVPMLVSFPPKKEKRLLFGSRAMRFPLPHERNSPLILNAGATGVYRVDYPAEIFRNIIPMVERKSLSPEDRLSLQGDAFALAGAGEFPTALFLELACAFRDEDNFTVWSDFAGSLGKLDSLFAAEPWLPMYREFARSIFSPGARKLGWRAKPGEPHTVSMLRSLLLGGAAHYGDQEIINRALKLFDRFKKGNKPHADIRGVVYGSGASYGGEETFRFLVRAYKQEHLHEEKNRIGRSLGRFKKGTLLKKTLAFSLSDDVRPQDAPAMISSVWLNHQGREYAWSFLQSNWKELLRRYGGGGHMFPSIVRPIGVFASKEKASEVKAFFAKHEAPGAERAVRQVLERIESNADWLVREKAAVKKWLVKRYGQGQ